MKDHDVHSLSHTKWECKYHIVFARRIVKLSATPLKNGVALSL